MADTAPTLLPRRLGLIDRAGVFFTGAWVWLLVMRVLPIKAMLYSHGYYFRRLVVNVESAQVDEYQLGLQP